MDSTNADALYVRGLCLYYEDCIEKAVQFFVQALRMAPDHEKACLACRVSWDRRIPRITGFLTKHLTWFCCVNPFSLPQREHSLPQPVMAPALPENNRLQL